MPLPAPTAHAYTIAANPALRRIFLGDDLVSGYICFASYFDRLRLIDSSCWTGVAR
jgi:hypothetical protein